MVNYTTLYTLYILDTETTLSHDQHDLCAGIEKSLDAWLLCVLKDCGSNLTLRAVFRGCWVWLHLFFRTLLSSSLLKPCVQLMSPHIKKERKKKESCHSGLLHRKKQNKTFFLNHIPGSSSLLWYKYYISLAWLIKMLTRTFWQGIKTG